MKKLKAVIVDDEKIARDVLTNYLTTYCSEKVEITSVCDGFNSAVETLRKESVDFVFLDIEMPFGNGLDVLESIGQYDFKVIFTTAFDQYAIEALSKHAFDYLLKPVSIKKLMKSVDDVYSLYEQQNQTSPIPESNSIDLIKIPSNSGFDLIQQESIVFAKASDNYCEIHLLDGTKHLVSKTLKKIESELNSNNFIRVHKSYLANIKHIKSYERSLGGQLVLEGEFEVPISSTGKKLLNNLI